MPRDPSLLAMLDNLIDPSTLDLSGTAIPDEELRNLIPQDHEFRMIDRVAHLDLENQVAVGIKEFGKDAWWGPGHIPGRPLLPGVLMVEGAAQIATVLLKNVAGWPVEGFVGFGGLDKVRFRGAVEPPCTLQFVSCKGKISGRRMARFPAAAWCNGKQIMEMTLIGVLL